MIAPGVGHTAVIIRHKDAVANAGGAKGDALHVSYLQFCCEVVCCQGRQCPPEAVPCVRHMQTTIKM